MKLLEVLSDNSLECKEKLLSFLDYNDLLRLRRVSKPFKSVIEDFIRTKKIKSGGLLFINFEMDKPFEQHFEFQDNSSFEPQRKSLFLYNYNARQKSFSMNKLLECFLDSVGTTNITTLVIEGLIVPRDSNRIRRLFDSLSNVTHLKLRGLLCCDDDYKEEEDESSTAPKEITIPTGFKKLVYLELNPKKLETATPTARKNLFQFCLKLVETYISNLERLYLLFGNFVVDSVNRDVEQDRAVRLACMCLFGDQKVKLESVEGRLIELLLKTDDRLPEMGTVEDMGRMINAKVVSVLYPRAMTFMQELPNLENLVLGYADHYCSMPTQEFVRPEWRKLGEIWVDFKNFDDTESLDEWGGIPSLRMLWDFLFVGIIRKNLVDLQMGFDDFDEPNAYFPRTLDILTSCPSLKILRLGTKVRQLVVLPELWNGLPQLEELEFSRCSCVIDADFVGEDDSSPVFWNLKRLKVLKFSSMEEMNVTDKLFSKVVCHMPLKELYVHSDVNLNSITLAGFESLLTGNFSTTIEKLSLDLAGVSIKEQDSMKMRFRSWKMI